MNIVYIKVYIISIIQVLRTLQNILTVLEIRIRIERCEQIL